jgi:hypothetical protein
MIELIGDHLKTATEARARIIKLISGKVLQIVEKIDTNNADRLNTKDDE